MAVYATQDVPERFERLMSASPAEFLRCLQVALPAGSVELLGAQGCRVRGAGVELVLDFEPAGERRIALLVLPQLRVRYRFTAGDAAARADFLTRLDRAMQRGGG